MCERAEFCESCNLIGSGSGRNPSPSCVSLCDGLKFPFFGPLIRLHTEVIVSKQIFIRRETWKYNLNEKDFSLKRCVCESPTAFTIKRGASQQLKQ